MHDEEERVDCRRQTRESESESESAGAGEISGVHGGGRPLDPICPALERRVELVRDSRYTHDARKQGLYRVGTRDNRWIASSRAGPLFLWKKFGVDYPYADVLRTMQRCVDHSIILNAQMVN